MAKFPRTIAAFAKGERTQWAIGDALLAECGAPSEHGVNDDSYTALTACAAELLEHGHETSTRHLAKMRQVAHNFPPDVRVDVLPWAVHQAACNPENLKKIVKWGRKQGERVTVSFVEQTFELWRLAADQARQKEHAAAKQDREKAESTMRKARAVASAAKDDGEKKTATARAEAAAEQCKKAAAREQATKSPPKKRYVKPVDDPGAMDMLVRMLEVSQARFTIKGLVRGIREKVVPHLGKVDQEGIEVHVGLLYEAADELQNLITGFEAYLPQWKRGRRPETEATVHYLSLVPTADRDAAIDAPVEVSTSQWSAEAIDAARAIAAEITGSLNWIEIIDECEFVACITAGQYKVLRYYDEDLEEGEDKFGATYHPKGVNDILILGTGKSIEEVRRIAEDHWDHWGTIASSSAVPASSPLAPSAATADTAASIVPPPADGLDIPATLRRRTSHATDIARSSMTQAQKFDELRKRRTAESSESEDLADEPEAHPTLQ